MGRISEPTYLEGLPIRPDIAREVFGTAILDGPVKVVLTRVAPHGGVGRHRDGYGHLLYFLGGTGRGEVDGVEFLARPGVVVHIDPGEEHLYENTGDDDLTLISMNIPPHGAK